MRLVPSAIAEVQALVCARHQITRDDMLSPRQTATIVKARHTAMFLAKKLTNRSWLELGRRFHRDHATVIYGVRRVRRLARADRSFAAEVAELEDEARRRINVSSEPDAGAVAADRLLARLQLHSHALPGRG